MTNNAKRQRQGNPSADVTSVTITETAIERFCQMTVRAWRPMEMANGIFRKLSLMSTTSAVSIVTSCRAHRNADRRCRQCRRIIDAIADHRDWTDFSRRLEHTNFVFGQQVRVKFVQTRLLRYRSCRATIVAREHDDAPDPDFLSARTTSRASSRNTSANASAPRMQEVFSPISRMRTHVLPASCGAPISWLRESGTITLSASK